MIDRLKIALLLPAVMWVVFFLQQMIPGNLSYLGILPRTSEGLFCIPLAPFLHSSFSHLLANTLPLTGISFLIQLKSRTNYFLIVFGIILFGGSGVWLFGSQAYHLGASGLVLGLWAYILADAFFRRSVRSILIACITLFFYASLVFGLLDLRAHISVSGHFFGLLSGVLFAAINVHFYRLRKAT